MKIQDSEGIEIFRTSLPINGIPGGSSKVQSIRHFGRKKLVPLHSLQNYTIRTATG